MAKSRRTKLTDIPAYVKNIVWERDGGCCIICGSPQAMPNAHYIPRSRGGLGIEENIVTLCTMGGCHYKYDFTDEREAIGSKIKEYLKSQYPNWDESKLAYDKWEVLK